MERDHPDAPHVPDESDERRNRALARYDAHPGIAILLLAVMAVVVVAVTFQLVSNRFDGTRVTTAPSHPPSPQHGGQSAQRPDRALRVGVPAFSLDGNKVGAVESVHTAPDGAVTAITVAVERQLGLGAKRVAIPMSKFTTRDEIVHIDLTASDIAALPDQGP
jgi:PRC-barrel domain